MAGKRGGRSGVGGSFSFSVHTRGRILAGHMKTFNYWRLMNWCHYAIFKETYQLGFLSLKFSSKTLKPRGIHVPLSLGSL